MPAISAKFTADVSDFRAKLQTLTTEVTGFDRTQKQVASELRKFGNDFSGANTIRQFESMAKAVDQLGGTSRLTVTEVSRVGAAAVEVLAKYQALGHEAPADIQRIADEAIKLKAANDAAAKSAADIEKATKKAGDSAPSIAGLFGKIGGAVAGAFSIGAVVSFGGALVDTVSKIHDTAEELDISTDAVQELKYAATQAGTSFEGVTSSMEKLTKNIQEGSTKTRQSVSDLGLSFDQLKQLGPDELFSAVAEAMRQVQDPGKQIEIAIDLMGKSGAKNLPMIKEGLADLRKEAHEAGQVIGKEAVDSIEALGDAWDRVKTRVNVGASGLITDLINAHKALSDLLPSGGASTGPDMFSPASMGEALKKDAAEAARVMAALTAPKRTADISLGAGSGGAADLVSQLQHAREEIAKFTPEIRAAIAAGEAMGTSDEKIAQSLSILNGGVVISTQAVELYTKAQKEAIKLSPEKAFGEAAQKADELAVFIQKAGGATTFSREKQAEFNKTLLDGAEAHRALKTAASPVYDLVLKEAFATESWAKTFGPVKNGIEDVIKGMNALPSEAAKTEILTGAYAKLDQTVDQTAKTIRAVGDAGANADKAYVSSINRIIDAYHSFGLVSTQELQRTAIQTQQNYQILLNSGTATTAQLRIAYEQMIYAQVVATGKIPSVWQTIAHDLPALFGAIADSFADNLGKMLTGQESFKDGFLGIWHDIQKGLGNILSDIVSQFERTFIGNITASLLGGGSVWGGIIQAALGQGFQAGAAQALTSGAGRVAGSLITNAAYGTGAQSGASVLTQYGTSIAGGSAGLAGGSQAAGTSAGLGSTAAVVAAPAAGALVGGIVGWKVGRATGNWELATAAGAGSGAATGAVVGSVVPGAGTAVGAGVGAAVGAIAGAWAAHKANEDARDQMVEIRGELEKTFGSLDNVRKQAQFVGVDIDKAFEQIGRGVKGTKEFNAVVDDFQKKWNDLDAAMKRYGITTEELQDAQKTSTQIFADQAKQLQTDYTALMGTGGIGNKDTVITKMADSFNALLIAAKDTGSKIPAELEPVLDRMNELGLISDDARAKLLGLASASSGDLQKATEIANKYGISLAQLGPSFQQAQISARAKEILSDFTDLKGLNVDIGGSLAGMSDEISQFVNDAIKAGSEVPENMRPILEELINNGQLIDENGDKLQDLTGIKFGQPMADQFAPVTDAIHDLIDVLTGKSKDSLPGALQAGIDQMAVIASKAQIRIPVGFDIPNLPDNFPDGYPNSGSTPPGERPMASGGIVFGPTHALIGEEEPELVAPLRQLPSLLGPMRIGSQPIVVQSTVYLDGAIVARSAQRHWSRELRASGAAR